MALPAWLRPADGGITLELAVQPGAKKNELGGEHGGALKVKVASPPVDGAANEALLAFLASVLGVRARDVTLLRGATSRRKVVAVAGLSPEAAQKALAGGGVLC